MNAALASTLAAPGTVSPLAAAFPETALPAADRARAALLGTAIGLALLALAALAGAALASLTVGYPIGRLG
jgi:hypothetical protein